MTATNTSPKEAAAMNQLSALLYRALDGFCWIFGGTCAYELSKVVLHFRLP